VPIWSFLVDSQEIDWNCCHQIFCWKSLQCSPRSLSWILGVLLLKRERRERGGKRSVRKEKKERKKKAKKERERKRKSGEAPNLHFWLRHCATVCSNRQKWSELKWQPQLARQKQNDVISFYFISLHFCRFKHMFSIKRFAWSIKTRQLVSNNICSKSRLRTICLHSGQSTETKLWCNKTEPYAGVRNCLAPASG